MKSCNFWVGLVFVSTLGAALGQLLGSKRAWATSCAPERWNLSLVSVTSSSESGETHGSFWPQRARLSTRPGHVSIVSESHEAGVVSRAGAGQ